MGQVGSIILVGGGLANGLAAMRLAKSRPDLSVQLIEAGPTFGGRHTWCWHGSDLAKEQQWLLPLASASWTDYDVRFPTFERTLRGTYHALRSEDFHRHVASTLGDRARSATTVRSVHADHVVLDSGETLYGDSVLDSRGLDAGMMAPCGYQKFYGLFVTTAKPHKLQRPMLMDASVEQDGGYRFVYTLPWSDRELLVEDTRYSDDPNVDRAAMHSSLLRYLEDRGLSDSTVSGEEIGSLPIPLYGAEAPQSTPGVIMGGVRAGLFHPTTGYSLPEAARFADWLAATRLSGPALAQAAALRSREVWRRGGFCRRLNNMLFMAALPGERRTVMEQFYGRNAGLIARFYSGSSTLLDRVRMLSGKPPVPIAAGVKAFFVKATFT